MGAVVSLVVFSAYLGFVGYIERRDALRMRVILEANDTRLRQLAVLQGKIEEELVNVSAIIVTNPRRDLSKTRVNIAHVAALAAKQRKVLQEMLSEDLPDRSARGWFNVRLRDEYLLNRRAVRLCQGEMGIFHSSTVHLLATLRTGGRT